MYIHITVVSEVHATLSLIEMREFRYHKALIADILRYSSCSLTLQGYCSY